MEIKVSGTGCARCISLENITKKAIEELGLDTTVENVAQIKDLLTQNMQSHESI